MTRAQNDVLSLLVQLDIPDFQYWEFHRFRQRLAASARWPLVVNTDRAMTEFREGDVEATLQSSGDDVVAGIPIDDPDAGGPQTALDVEEPVSLEIESPYAESTVKRRERQRAQSSLSLLRSVQNYSKKRRS